MANKYNLITELYNSTVKEVTGSHENWTAFLTSACKNYKCSFDEQLLIHAQRPDATAVLPIETWNKRFGRWVNKGAKGIAVFDRENAKLKHYFDISDTHENQYSREVPLWQMNERYESEVVEALGNAFGELDDNTSLAQSLISAADNLVIDNMADYLQELNNCREGSFLEELDELNVEVFYRETLTTSVAYMLLSRLGLDAEMYFDREDFEHIYDFNTPNTINALGTATSDIAELGLLEIASTILNIKQQEKIHTFAKRENTLYDENRNNERTGEQNEHNVFNAGRLSDSRLGNATGERNDVGQIRTSSQEILAEQPQNNVYESADDRQIERTSDGNRADGTNESGNANLTNGENTGRKRADESDRPNEMGGADEQHTPQRGGDDTARLDLQLNNQTEIAEEKPSAFFMPTSQQMNLFAGQQLDISQQIIDEVLTSGGNKDRTTLRICANYKKNKTPTENIAFLKREYKAGGKGFNMGDTQVAAWFDESGIRIAQGKTALEAKDGTLITWEAADKRIKELLDLGRFMPQSELDKVDDNELTELSNMLWYVYRDDFRNLPNEYQAERGGFPEDMAVIKELLSQPETLSEIIEKLKVDVANFESDPDAHKWHNVRQFQSELSDLEREPLNFTAQQVSALPSSMFITQDEVDSALIRGSSISEGKFRIYSFFLKNTDPKERADFLKDEYGTGGGTGALSGAANSYEDHSPKGLVFSRGIISAPYDKVELSWSKAAKRVDELISSGRFMSKRELDYIPTYEKTEIARAVYIFFSNKSMEIARPFPYAFDYYATTKIILEQLNNPENIAEIVAQMTAVKDTLSPSDRHYGSDLQRYNDVLDFQSGKFSLFGETRKSVQEIITETVNADVPYNIHLGDSVYLGTDEYELYSIDENKVLLRDMHSPLIIEEMEREVFDRRLRENPLNDNLKVAETIDEVDEKKALSEEYSDIVGKEFSHNGRTYRIKKIRDYSSDVSLTDLTFQNGVGFPINRLEPLERVLGYLSEHEKKLQAQELIPAWEKAKHKSIEVAPVIQSSERHNFTITDDNLGVGGAKTKYAFNVAAIKTLQTIESENRLATPEEQEILSKYVGWGGVADAFDSTKDNWAREYAELKSLLGEDEYTSARESTLNAHYTSPTVIKAIYSAIENMGFKTGNILEPACGVGNFFGLLPESMNDSNLYGVELDGITGRIAKQLYQQSNIAIQGFETTNLPDSFFDVAIGNVPFGNYGVADKRYDKHNFLIHDYFFAKTLDKVRPGGIVAFVTSSGTMDKKNSAVRKYIAQRADLLGAIRLPNNAFLANAGTQVVADILFLQKRDRIIDIEPEWVSLGKNEDGYTVNSYFVDNPDMVLGELTEENTQYGNQDLTVRAIEGANLADQLSDAITNIHAEITEYERDDVAEVEDKSIPADPNVRNFSFCLVDGEIYFRENSKMSPMDIPVTAQNRIKGMIALRDCVRTLIEYQTEDFPDSDIAAEQAKLNKRYDNFTLKYGLLGSRANSTAFSSDSSYCLLCSLEVINENGELERKADMFNKRTIKPKTVITSVDTPSDALVVSLSEKARVDLGYMQELTGIDMDKIISELSGIIFKIPQNGEPVWVTAEEYLSGNVREKLQVASAYAMEFEEFEVNVKALQAVLPKDLSATEISVRLGATWLPADIARQFMFELLDTPRYCQYNMKVHFSSYTAEWNIEGKNYDRSNIKAVNTYGTHRINAYKIIEETLNLRDVRIFDYVEDENGNKKAILNKKETAIAQSKQELIKQQFSEWVWKDPTRREQLCRLYNDKFNSIRPREYDGKHIRFSGINPEIELMPHQINAIAHVMYGGNTLLAHEVGAGKTYEMVAAAMESKRLGLCHKSLIVVPNHITEQWASEFLQLYPAANILVATKKDFETKNRKKFCGRIATGDYDAVIIGHSQFEKIPMSIERQRAILQQQLDEVLDGIGELKRNRGENFSIKQLEKTKKSIKLKLDKLNDQSRKDNVVTFEELGVDRLFVDESHYFKNLFLFTKMRNVGGIAQTEAQKSSDLFMKCRYLDELTGGKGIVFATGTPISNSMVELYTVQRYLQYETLARNGLQHFDSWASTFGETITAIELDPTGSGFRAKTRFSKFYNLPELMSMFKEVADIQTADMLNLPVPKANYHNIVVKPSDMQKELLMQLSERADRVRAKMVDPTQDNMLLITNDGRKLALDQRLMNELLPDEQDSKVSACVENVFKIWEQRKDDSLAQLVFCDLSTPKDDGTFSVYNDIRSKLMARGMPEDEVAFIHNANTETQKKELFAKVRQGKVRVLLGSTQKMGAGTNVQDRLIALHDVDCPWRPSDLTQRSGRIIRQGNQNPEVEIFRYVTEQTFDSYLYQLVENKQRFISQIMTSKSPVRSAEDVDEASLSYAEIKALATGNPLIIEKCNLEMEVGKLNMLKGSHLSQKYELEDKLIKHYPQEIRRLEERIAGFKADIAHLKTPSEKEFSPMTIHGTVYADKDKAGAAIIESCKRMTSPEAIPLGEYRGFLMELSFDVFSKEYRITLKNELSHTVALGSDVFGNITRLDNALSSLPNKLNSCTEQFENTKSQMEVAMVEIDKPFARESELSEKTARLGELNAMLNLDQKDEVIIEGEVEETTENEPIKEKGRDDYER